MSLKKIFKKDKDILIGAIHFPPLLGYKDFPGFDIALKNALADLRAFEQGGVDGIIFENNYDIPHKISVDKAIVASMTLLGQQIKAKTKLPLGVSVLWNDYEAALSIAKTLDLRFVRVPAFVDKVKTNYGIAEGNAREVIAFRKAIRAEDVAIFTDIHVKHAKLLSKHSLTESAKLAIKNGSDALILTGQWTGDAPPMDDLRTVRKEVGLFPILIGSGLDSQNARLVLDLANGAIVSTSLKRGVNEIEEVNVKPYAMRISKSKVKQLIDSIRAQ
ncbi:MAG: BtpA/SgcQ family protein [bacterium]|nr:BtpA/SgcQ family protein [bacterium]